MKLHNYTLRYLTITLVIVIGIWIGFFFIFTQKQVLANVDNELKSYKIEIIKEFYNDPKLLNTQNFTVTHFRITPLPPGNYTSNNQFTTIYEKVDFSEGNKPVRLLTTAFYDTKKNPYKLEIKSSMVTRLNLWKHLCFDLLSLYSILLLCISIFNYFLLKRVWKSFYQLLEKLKNYVLGSEEKFISPDTKIKEFQDLEKEIERMIRRNELTFAQKKLYIGNVAHELQTPLAISINKLELLADDPQITKKHMKEISAINDCLTRLTKLNRSLLMLFKIENNQFVERENIVFNNLIKDTCEEFSDLTLHKNIQVFIEEKGTFLFKMDKGLAITLINNLFKNAIIYNYHSGTITFSITNSYFIIKNTSLQSELDTNQLYNQFYKNTNNPLSTGLGLTLVKTITDCYPDLFIEYYFDGAQNFKVLKIY